MHVVSAHWSESLDWLKSSSFAYTIVDKVGNPKRDPDTKIDMLWLDEGPSIVESGAQFCVH